MDEVELPQFFSEFERIYQILNKGLFNSELENPHFVILEKKKVSIRWTPGSIIIGQDILKLEFSEIPGVLLHEMVHISNYQQGISDVTTNQYHNKYFLKSALEIGFHVIKHKTQGWSITSLTNPRNAENLLIKHPQKDKLELRNQILNLINLDKACLKSIFSNIEQINKEKPSKTYFLKYECQCPPPHNSIRSGRRPDGPNALNIFCQNCKSYFECVSLSDVLMEIE